VTSLSETVKSLSTSLIWRGILAIAIGVVAFAWPNITIGAFVIIFAVYAFLAGITEFTRAFASATAGPVAGHIALGLLDIAAGVIAIAWPSITAIALVAVVAIWAFVIGVMEIALVFRQGETAGERALLGLTGLISVALGVAFAVRPDIGAVTIAQVYGLFSVVYGISSIVIATNVRRTRNMPSVARLAA
jgi:uncharacterized membrane protein HdeD (DUF308 family)